jgi:hypothetical protein
MRQGWRAVWDRIGPFRFAAGVLVVLGVLSLLLEVQSPSFRMFNGIKVHASTLHGTTSYTYKGVPFQVANKYDHSSHRHPTTVYLSRSDPTDSSKAYIGQASVWWIDVVTTVGPFVLAFLLLLIGMARDRRRRTSFADRIGSPGAGMPADFVARQLQQLREPTRPTDV